MKVAGALLSKVQGRVRLSQFDALTGERVWRGDWEDNLVFDTYLNLLASNVTGYGDAFTQLVVGSGTNPNSFNFGGSAIFTQAGTTITATSAVFTSAMIGGIFKYGATGTSNGAEQYIASIGGGGLTATVVGAGMTVAVAAAATVWMVQQTSLQTFVLASTTYSAATGANGWTAVGNIATLFRTFVFARQGSSYTVNEVGYANTGMTGGTCNGRIVIGSATVVPPSNFLVAEFTLTINQSPSAQISQSNVGTGFNTTGTAMLQVWDIDIPATNGNPSNVQGGGGCCNLCSNFNNSGTRIQFAFHFGAAITLQTSIQNSIAASAAETFQVNFSVPLGNAGQPVGVGIMTNNYSFTSAGQTCNALVFGASAGAGLSQIYVINLTTPVVLPNGSLQGTVTWMAQYTRTLVN